MRTSINWLLLAVLGVVTPAFPAHADDKPAEGRRTISVSAQGEVTAAPDIAVVSVAVETTAPKADDAVKANAARSTKVADALKGLIGKDDKITTTRYSLEPRYEPMRPGETSEPHITGYVARNEVQVETHQVNAAGTLIDAGIAAGANRISGLQFTLASRNAQLRAALEKAGGEARAQAESVANALGVKLKGVASAIASTGPIVQPRFEGRAMMAMEARPPTPVEPGTVSVSATLQVTYDIE